MTIWNEVTTRKKKVKQLKVNFNVPYTCTQFFFFFLTIRFMEYIISSDIQNCYKTLDDTDNFSNKKNHKIIL